ncbi:MAG: superoxide dismutase [Gammaproteobacteria bacterium]|jgi:Fe-Mn family superoxide dismutase
MTVYTLPELPYAYDALEPHLSAETLKLHHDKHHATYVKGANEAMDKMSQARAKGEFATINQLQKDLAFNLSGHFLHSLFWQNMSPDGGGKPSGDLARAIGTTFGGYAGFSSQFEAAAAKLQGSGWVSLAWEPLGKQLMVEQVLDHQENIGNGTLPILVMDMWEHSYYLQYQNRKADWVAAFWELVNWDDVAQRYAKVTQTDVGLN